MAFAYSQREAEPPADEDDMPATERELAEDAQWKVIQKNTFTRWTNEHLKKAQKNLADLEFDLTDGLRLIALVEVLSGKKFKHINKRPSFRHQKLENVSLALKFLEEDEGIKIVNIDSTDIVDSKLKLILGLIWTLILHYSISMPMWEGEEDQPQREAGAKEGPTPKQRLLIWVQNKLPDLPVSNFTTDWNDGRAIGALVDAVGPGLCPDWQDWDPSQAKRNATEAMDLAEKWLDVPQLIRPEEMVNPKVDELSMMTYLSQFPNAKLRTDAPLRPRTNAARVRAYGPGLEQTGNSMGAPSKFTIETFSAGRGEPVVRVLNASNVEEPCQVVFNNDRNLTYSCQYLPTMEGEYTVIIQFAGKEIPKSPFKVKVEGAAGDATKVRAAGPGLEPSGVQNEKKTFFEVYVEGAGVGNVEVVIVDPQGRKDTTKPRVAKTTETTFYVEYLPKDVGRYTVHIYFAGKEIPASPFTVGVAQPVDSKKCYATGRGVQSKGVRVKDIADFKVHTEGAGDGELKGSLVLPGGKEEPIRFKSVAPNVYEATYVPTVAGEYTLNVTYGGGHITKSPFKINIGKQIVSNIRAYGPGLEGGIANKPADFVVETNGETGSLGFAVEGPSQAKIDCKDNGDGSANVSYLPTVPGEYAVHVLCNNEDIPNSPYIAQIGPATKDFFPEKVIASGPGLQPKGPVVGKPAQFTIDTASAGLAPLRVVGQDAEGQPIDVQLKDNKDGTYTCQYTPKTPTKHTIFVTYGGVCVPNSPFRVGVIEASRPEKVRVYGPGIEKSVKCFQPNHFFVDTKDAGPGEVAIALTDDRGAAVPVKATDNGSGVFRVEYEPKSIGAMKANVYFAEQEIPASPFKVSVEPNIDVNKVKVEGLEPSVFLDSTTDFTVDAKSVTSTGEGKVRAIVTGPTGTKTDTTVVSAGDGTYSVSYLPYEQGAHSIDVTYEGLTIPKSPFPVKVVPGNDPSRVKANGSGLTKGYTNQPQTFTVSTRGAGQGNLGIAVEGPSKAEVQCEDNHDGTCTVTYVPTKAGPYDVAVKFADKHVPGSPFHVPIEDIVDPSKCRAYGPGLNPEGVRATLPASFTVDCTEAGDAPLEVAYDDGHGGPRRPAEIKKVQDGLYQATYYPAEKGQANVQVLYAGQHVPGSPFKQKVLPSHDASRVRVAGDGVKDAVPASLPTSFVVDTKDAGVADVSVAVQAPDGSQLRPLVHDNLDGTVTVSYTPEDVGKYQAKVKFGGEPVPGSPFTVTAVPSGDASKCRVKDDPPKKKVVVGEECVITVNTAAAGKGNVTCRIRTPTDTDADIDIEDNGDGTVSIHYTPRTPGAYQISIKFGGVTIPNGDYTVQAVPAEDFVDEGQIAASQVNGFHAAPKGNVFHPVDFVIPVGPVFNLVEAQIHSPSGHVSQPEIVDNGDGSVTIKFQPTETGLHQLHVSYNGRPIEGSPYDFFVDSINSASVTAYGPGLSYGIAGQPCTFTIDTKNAGAGGLSLAVEGPSKADIKCCDNDDGTCTVSYTPTEPGLYKVMVKFEDDNIVGSPFTAYIAESRNKAQVSMGAASEFQLAVNEYDIASLTADITAPSGRKEPCTLKKLPNGHLGISFTPHETGTHLVNVYREGRHIANSPFKINVTPNEKGNASKVKVYGKGLTEGLANQDNEFVIDTKDAGYGGLSISVEGPSKAEIDCKDQADGSCLVSYKPTEPGSYVINIKFADEHVPGSPFTCKIGGMSSAKQREELTRQQRALDVTHVGSICEVNLKVPGSDPMDMVASVTSPSGATELCDIIDQRTDLYTIKFVPKEMGVHTVSVKHKATHVPGSPFQFTVGPITDGGAHRVRAAGPGLERGEVDVNNEFNVYTREAGAGGLAISVEGPSKADIHFEDKHDGSCVVGYTCTEPGEYVVSIKFNDQHIPDSPFRVPVMPHSGDARKLTVQSLQQKGLEIGRPCAFTVTFNGAQGNLQAHVIAPSGAEDEALIQSLDDSGGHFAIRFIPRENGVHYVHVLLNGNHIRGSPFRVLVGESDPDPGLVTAFGEGLVKGETFKPAKFVVATAGAGASTLAVTVDGPSKVQLQAHEVPEGYEFTYTPTAPGDYLIAVKYGGNCHIAGSPYKAKITGAGELSRRTEHSQCVVETAKKTTEAARVPKFNSDASKVSSKGLGLNKAFINKKAQFTVDTSLAGNNMLFVGVIGPVGAPPCDEVIIKNQSGTNQYNVSYTVKQKGKHLLIVKWGDEHVPGSPFQIDVV